MGKPNIKDVARVAGVSVATVSHVLNKTRYVSDRLTEQVLRAVEETDYQPNVIAGSLRRKKTQTVGLIVPDLSNALYAELSKAIEDRLFRIGITLMLCNSEHQLAREKEYIRALRAKMVDGLIIIPAADTSDHINRLADSGLPVVVLDRPLRNIRTDYVLIDHYQGAFDAADYLLDRGVTRIGYIGKMFPLPHKFDRLRGLQDALKKHGVSFDENLHVECGVSLQDGARAMQALLNADPAPDGVICFDDTIAMGALRAIHDRGLKVPGDVALIGFDDMPLCSYTVPRLTTVYYPRVRMAEVACSLLQRKMDNVESDETSQVVLPLRLVVRESTP